MIHTHALDRAPDQFGLAVLVEVGQMNGRVVLRLIPWRAIRSVMVTIRKRAIRPELHPTIASRIIVPYFDPFDPAPDQFSLTVSVDVG